MLSRREKIAVGILTVFAAFLRFYRLDWQGFWFDETFTVYSAALDFRHLRAAVALDPYPPLYNALIWLWIKAAGIGEYQIRLISVIFGALTVPICYALTRRMFTLPVALLASAMIGCSQVLVQYSQEARSYAMLCFLIAAATWFYLLAWDDPSRANRIGLALCAGAVLWTHYYGLFPLLAMFVHWWFFRHSSALQLRQVVGIATVACVPFLVWLVLVPLSDVYEIDAFMPQESLVLALANATNRLHNAYFFGATWKTSAWTLPLGFLLFTAPALWGIAQAWKNRRSDPRLFRHAVLLALMVVLPVACSSTASAFGVIFAYRYWIPAMAPYYFLTAFGLLQLPSRPLSYGAIALLFGLALAALQTHYSVPNYPTYRDGWRYVLSQYSPQDCAATAPWTGNADPHWSWYAYAAGRPYPHRIAAPPQLDREACDTVWVFRDRNPWQTSRPIAIEEQLASHYRLAEEHLFSALEVKRYRRLPE